MQSDPADRTFKAGHPRLWVAGLVLFALVAALFAFTRGGPETAVLPSPTPSTSRSDTPVTTREDDAAALLDRLTSRLGHGTRKQTLALAAPGDKAATRELGVVFGNIRRLGITDLSLRYVDEDDGRLSAAQQRRLGENGWVGDVDLGWRIAGYERVASDMEVNLTFVETPGGAAFVSARGDYGDAAPLWLLDKLAVQRSRRSLVMVADPSRVNVFAAQARHAVADVKKVLPRWRGRLVIEAPATQTELDHTLGADDHSYDAIAAVTTTTDRSTSPSSPTHVFVNPEVFDDLGKEGAQIVISHEATHVATGAATSSMPTWLLEGFADYVALAHVDLPVSATASQILGDVRKDGVPKHLPGSAEFDTANTALGASYESAWLACRLLGEKYGQQKLVAFYRQSDRDSSTDRAFHDILGTNQRAFTRAWKTYLAQLAS